MNHNLIIVSIYSVPRELGTATVEGDADKVESLLEQGADPDHQFFWCREWGMPPVLHYACWSNQLKIVKLMFEKGGADVDERSSSNCVHKFHKNKTPLGLACQGGHKDIVQYLVEEARCDIGE